MSTQADQELDLEAEADEFEEPMIADEDYAIVIGADGRLKNILLPVGEVMEYPENVHKILELFGIENIDDVIGEHTIH